MPINPEWYFEIGELILMAYDSPSHAGKDGDWRCMEELCVPKNSVWECTFTLVIQRFWGLVDLCGGLVGKLS